MKTIFISIIAFVVIANISYAQNDTMYIMKNGLVVGKLNVSEIDSVIFYRPATVLTTVTDIDGNVYLTVTIGTQVWMAENLKTTKLIDGSAIPLVTDTTVWSNLITPGYCWYNNDSNTYAQTYGALYNWYTVETGNLCPTGWHVPTDADWTTLIDYLGGGAFAGGKLKETGTNHWESPNTGATNESGFSALPGGYRNGIGGFYMIGVRGAWWHNNEIDASTAWTLGIHYSDSNVDGLNANKRHGHSVRCMKD
jgi:uncharacterized protein (TIGR02145 family)